MYRISESKLPEMVTIGIAIVAMFISLASFFQSQNANKLSEAIRDYTVAMSTPSEYAGLAHSPNTAVSISILNTGPVVLPDLRVKVVAINDGKKINSTEHFSGIFFDDPDDEIVLGALSVGQTKNVNLRLDAIYKRFGELTGGGYILVNRDARKKALQSASLINEEDMKAPFDQYLSDSIFKIGSKKIDRFVLFEFSYSDPQRPGERICKNFKLSLKSKLFDNGVSWTPAEKYTIAKMLNLSRANYKGQVYYLEFSTVSNQGKCDE